MSGYGHPQNPSGYGQPYGAPPPGQPPSGYGAPPPTSHPYGAAQPYGAPPPSSAPYGSSPSAPPYGKPDKPPKDSHNSSSGYPSAPPHTGSGYPSHTGSGYQSGPPSHQYGGGGGGGYPPAVGGSPFAALVPSTFPPGTDPTVVACFQVADIDGSGIIDDKELQKALSSYNQSFSLRTVHLLMNHFTNSNSRKIGPKEFISLFYGLQSWREIFERFDKDRSGKIDASELRDALYSLGFAVSPVILDLLVSKFDKTGGKNRAIEYDNFIECCLTVKGLTDKFKEKDSQYRGAATFTYEEFMLTVLPFLVA